MMEDKVDVWEIRVDQLLGRVRDETICTSVAMAEKTIAALNKGQKEAIERSLLKCRISFGDICLFDFWARVINLGYYRSPERLVAFSYEFIEIMEEITINRTEINETEAREREALEPSLFKKGV